MFDFVAALGDIASSEAAWVGAISFAALLAFAASGEWVAQKSGTLNISVEGMLLAGAFGAAIGQDVFGSVAIGMAVGAVGGLLVATAQAEMSHRLPADQFVVGLALNIGVLGLTGFLDGELEPQTQRATEVAIPVLRHIPLVGEAFFAQPWPMYLVYVVVPVTWWLIHRTRWGLEVRAIGNNPQSAHVSGIDVNLRRRQSVMIAGITSGLGGAYLTLALSGSFEESIVGGRGFIAIAAVIFGGWTLGGTIAGCLLFGTVLSFRLSLPLLGYELNNELLTSLPFVATLVGVALFARRFRPPASLAQPFISGVD